MQILADIGASITNSHFVYSSDRHSSVYINKDALYLHTNAISSLCQIMARPYNADQIDVVVGPVLSGIVLSQWVTSHLNVRRSFGETLAVYAEKEGEGVDKKFFFYCEYDKYIPGKNVLVVEDVLTTGGSARQVIELVRKHGGNVVGLSALCNRGSVQPENVDNVPIHMLITITLETFSEVQCPLGKRQIPINTELGKGRYFLAKQRTV